MQLAHLRCDVALAEYVYRAENVGLNLQIHLLNVAGIGLDSITCCSVEIHQIYIINKQIGLCVNAGDVHQYSDLYQVIYDCILAILVGGLVAIVVQICYLHHIVQRKVHFIIVQTNLY